MSSRTSLTFLQCDYFGSSLIRPLFSLLMCDVLLTVACPEHEVTWLWRRVGKNIQGFYALPFFRAPNPDAAQPQMPSLLLPPAAHLALCRAQEQQWCLDQCVEQPSSLEALAGGSLGQSGQHRPSDLRVPQGVLD